MAYHGFEAHVDPESGLTFYYNSSTGQTQWDPPGPPSDPHVPVSQPASHAQADTMHAQRVPTSQPSSHNAKKVKKRSTTKDYDAMAKEYVQFRAYRDLAGSQPCLLCNSAPSVWILFPCAHKCLCAPCAEQNHICASTSVQAKADGAWAFCPLCNSEIKRMSKHTGTEVDDYWEWVYEVKPRLPKGFQSRLSLSMQGGKVHSEKTQRTSSSTCILS